MARKSFCEVYIHLVWRTKYSRRILGGELELLVHERLREIGRDLDLSPLAVDSAWDHVQSYFRWHPSVAISDAVRTMKSKTAVEWNNPLRAGQRNGETLKWQIGYGAISTRRSDVLVVQDYIDTQKQRHRRNEVWAPFEQVEFSEMPADSARAKDYLQIVSREDSSNDRDVCREALTRCEESGGLAAVCS
jgi:REP element-mobilizing transposase RayT